MNAWLLEIAPPIGDTLYYRGPGDWCNNPNHAHRFRLQSDAERAHRAMQNPASGRVTEHEWPDDNDNWGSADAYLHRKKPATTRGCDFCEIDGHGNHAGRCPVQLEAELDELRAQLKKVKGQHTALSKRHSRVCLERDSERQRADAYRLKVKEEGSALTRIETASKAIEAIKCPHEPEIEKALEAVWCTLNGVPVVEGRRPPVDHTMVRCLGCGATAKWNGSGTILNCRSGCPGVRTETYTPGALR